MIWSLFLFFLKLQFLSPCIPLTFSGIFLTTTPGIKCIFYHGPLHVCVCVCVCVYIYIYIYIYVYIYTHIHTYVAFQIVLVVKNNAGDVRDEGSIPRSGRTPGIGNGNPLRYSCLENSTDRGTWQATVHRVAKELASNDFICAHTHTHTHTCSMCHI